MANIDADAAVQSPAARRGLRLLEFEPFRRNSLRGFASVAVSPFVVNDCPVTESHGRRWCSPPAKPMLTADGQWLRGYDGKPRYVPTIEFRTRELRDRFRQRVAELAYATHRGAFNP